jgi:predicted DNA-binding protein (MmcQ/YjbR family)
VDRDEARRACLALAGAVEEFPFGPDAAVIKVGGKMFAILSVDAQPGSVSLKCDPLYAEALREQYPAITAGYHLDKRHWNTVVLDDSVPDELISDLIRDSYELVIARLTKMQRAALGVGA